ncbi:MAG: hypothetical protein L0387_38490 [Acidobacteria bacterium]|nr:hypothetical protein [Acidobacteriota bacterium]MCI0724383.1 hypothetical protein [Acidobacteriota bacterium]
MIGRKLSKAFSDKYESLDEQTRFDILQQQGFDIDEDTGRWFMTDRDNKRLYLHGEQLEDAKREFLELAQSCTPI